MALSLSYNIFSKPASCMHVSVKKATSLSLITFLHSVSLFSNSASVLNPFALFLLPSTDIFFSVPYLDIRLLIAVAISVVYHFLAFLASFFSTSPSIMHYCYIVMKSQLSLDGFLLHLELHFRWGSNFSTFLAALKLGFQMVLAHFLYCPFLLL